MRTLLVTMAVLILSAWIQARADVLVRNCDTPTALGCAVTPLWVKSASAINVQVNRSGAPFVKLADIQPSERIAACYDDPGVAVGSSTKCGTTVPNRMDLWELKATLYPPDQVLGQINLTWSAVTLDSAGAPFAGTVGYMVSRQQDVCGTEMADPRCGTMPWITEDVGNVTGKLFTGIAGRWCFRVQGYTAAKDLGVISVPDANACNTAAAKKQLPGAPGNVKATAP